MNHPIYRQGDVLIVAIDSIPNAAQKTRRQHGRLILAEGEVTGHAHAIVDPHVDLYELVSPGDVAEMRRRFLHVENEAAIVHEEHTTITLPPGDYELRRQREYTPEAIRQVDD